MQLLKTPTINFYIDIGAHDPRISILIHISSYFKEAGMGFCIDPNSSFLEKNGEIGGQMIKFLNIGISSKDSRKIILS